MLLERGERPRTPQLYLLLPRPQHTPETSPVRCAGSAPRASRGRSHAPLTGMAVGAADASAPRTWCCSGHVPNAPVTPAGRRACCHIFEDVFHCTLMSTTFLTCRKPGREQHAHEFRKGRLPDPLEPCRAPGAPAPEETRGRGFLLTLIPVPELPLQDNPGDPRAAGDAGSHQCHHNGTALRNTRIQTKVGFLQGAAFWTSRLRIPDLNVRGVFSSGNSSADPRQCRRCSRGRGCNGRASKDELKGTPQKHSALKHPRNPHMDVNITSVFRKK